MRPSLFPAVLALLAGTGLAPIASAETAPQPPFALPQDWQWGTAPPGAWQARRGFTQGYALIQAARSPASGPPRAALVAAAATSSPPSERGEGETSKGQHLLFARWAGTNGVLGAVVLDDPAVNGATRTVLVLTGTGLLPERTPWARDAFEAAARSVQPGPAAPPVPLPSLLPGSGGLDGTVTGLHFVERPDGSGGTATLADVWVMLFALDGRFSRVPPTEDGGIDAHCRRHPGDCGIYRLLGGGWFSKPDRIELREGSGSFGMLEVRDMPFARRGGDMDIGETHLYPAAVLPHGAPFEGTWQMISVSVDAAVRRELTLSKDGRFRQAELEDGPSKTGREPVIASGRYAVDAARVTLEGDDGRRLSLGIVQPDAGNDGVLLIGGDTYIKRATTSPYTSPP